MTLIGATTENPYFEVNSALLSRAQIYELEPLGRGGAGTVVTRGAESSDRHVPDQVVALVAGGPAATRATR